MEPMENTRAEVIPAAPPAELPFERLDREVIPLWRLHHLISTVILLGLLGFIGAGFALALAEVRMLLLIVFLALAGLRIFLFFWLPPKRYAAWGYRLTDQVFETRYGIFTKMSQMVPLARLQHVDLQRGLIERRLGLASLVLYTAGTLHSVIIVPGLKAEVAAALRDKLVLVEGDDGV